MSDTYWKVTEVLQPGNSWLPLSGAVAILLCKTSQQGERLWLETEGGKYSVQSTIVP